MPWHVSESDQCPASKPWAVIKDADGTIEGCHATKAMAQAQMAALYASEPGGMMSEKTSPAELRYAVAHLEELKLREPRSSDNASDDLYLDGYAAVFNQETTLYDSKFMRLREVIAPGAFSEVLASEPDVHLVIGHNLDLPMARTGIEGTGGLQLSEDSHGLHVRARLNPKITYIRDLAENMRDGVVDQMSFAFTIADGGDTTDRQDDGEMLDELRTITRVGNLYDVTVTPQGAYSQTSAAIRSLAGLASRAAGTDIEVTTRGFEPATITPTEGRAPNITPTEGVLVLKRQAELAELRRRSTRLVRRDGG